MNLLAHTNKWLKTVYHKKQNLLYIHQDNILLQISYMRPLTTHSPLLNGHWRHCLWLFLGHRSRLGLIWYDVLGFRLRLRWDLSLWRGVGIRLSGLDCLRGYFGLYLSRGFWVDLCFWWWRLEVWLGFGRSLWWGLRGTVRRALEVWVNCLRLGFRQSARRTVLQVCECVWSSSRSAWRALEGNTSSAHTTHWGTSLRSIYVI